MPVIFVTVEEALRDLANLKRGERVLIHAAAGGSRTCGDPVCSTCWSGGQVKSAFYYDQIGVLWPSNRCYASSGLRNRGCRFKA